MLFNFYLWIMLQIQMALDSHLEPDRHHNVCRPDTLVDVAEKIVILSRLLIFPIFNVVKQFGS